MKPQEKEKTQSCKEFQNINLRSWLKLPYGSLLFRKITNKNERRTIIAFAIAAGFLLFTFWNSLKQEQLLTDLERATLDETLLSGKISESSLGGSKFHKLVIIYAEIDANGKPVIPVGMQPEITKQLQEMQFDPPKRNGVAIRVKIPITIGTEE